MKLLKIAGILAVACLLVFACVGAVSAEGEGGDGNDTSGDEKISVPSIAVTGVTAPVAGAAISKEGIAITAEGVTIGAVDWKKSSTIATGNFEYGTVYTLEIGISVNGTHQVTSATGITGLPSGATSVVSSDKITITFSATDQKISSLVIPSSVKPVTGNSPVSSVTIDHTSSNSVTWKHDSTTIGTGSTFEAGKSYTATFTINASSGYVFDDTVSVTIKDAGSSTPTDATQTIAVSDSTKKQITVTQTYPATTTITISSVELSGISAPVAGYTGSTTATVSKVNGVATTTSTSKVSVTEVKWYKGTSANSSAFAIGSGDSNKYKVSVKLTASAGYEFASPASVTISGWSGGSMSGSPAASSKNVLTVETTPVLASGTINLIEITVTDPSTGATPEKTASVKGNSSITISSSAAVKWMKTGTSTEYTSAFAAGDTYKAEITVPAAPTGYSYQSPTFKVNDHTGSSYISTSTTSSGGYTVTYTPGATGKAKITVVNITNLKVPTIGDSAASTSYTSVTVKGKLNSSSSDIPLGGSVSWYLGTSAFTGTFEANKTYTAKISITLGSSTGYEFNTSNLSVKVTDSAGTSKTYSTSQVTTLTKDGFTVSHEFAETNGTISAITISLTAPAIDGTPATYATVTSVTPSASLSTTSPSVTWNPYHTKFTGGYTYDVTITLTAKDGFTFDSYPSVTLSGTSLSSSAKSVSSDKKTLTIRHTYPKVTSAINEVYLDVSRPVAGHKPSTAVKVTSTKPSILGVTGTVAWSPSVAAEEEFAEHTVYTATVTLANSNSDYAFSSSTKVYVNGEAATVSVSGTQMKATYKFGETGEEGLISFGDVSIPYPTDFFHEFFELIKAFFMIGEWKLFE